MSKDGRKKYLSNINKNTKLLIENETATISLEDAAKKLALGLKNGR